MSIETKKLTDTLSDPQANLIYQEDAAALEDIGRVMQFVQHHRSYQRPRLERLDAYYRGQNGILGDESRDREEGKADHRISHPFAKYIADFQTAYSVGNPIVVQLDGKTHDDLDAINRRNDVDTVNYQLFLDTTRFGRAYELVYRNKADIEQFVRLDPLETFVIYDLGVDPQPVMAVRYHRIDIVEDGTTTEKYIAETWSDKAHTVYKPADLQATPVLDRQEAAPIMQVTEYKNNDFRYGDFESVLPLIDAYDAAESDTANYMTDLNDAMLVISGDIDALTAEADATADPSDKDYLIHLAKARTEMFKSMKEANMLLLRTGINAQGQTTQTTAGYIYKQYDVEGTEAYKKRLADDIHKFSHTPNLTDENFAGNVTGVAMKYKLLGVVELADIKRRMFERGLYRRYEVVTALRTAAKEKWAVDTDKISFTFHDNLPQDDLAQIAQAVQAGATLPQLYLYRYLPGGEDPDLLKKMLDKEREESPYNDIFNKRGKEVADGPEGSGEAKPGAAEAGPGEPEPDTQGAAKDSD